MAEVQSVRFDPHDPDFLASPYQKYAEFREHSPIVMTDDGLMMCFAYDDVRQLSKEQDISMNQSRHLGASATHDSHEPPAKPALSLLRRDPPDHFRIRRLMMGAFAPKNMATLGEWIDAETERLIDELGDSAAAGTGVVDAVDGLAFRLPFNVISRVLGMPDTDVSQVREWALDIGSATDPSATAEQIQKAAEATGLMANYVKEEVLPWKRTAPGDDLLTALLAGLDAGALVSEEELVAQITLLYTAGHDTTVGLIGNSILTLLAHPSERDRLIAEPSLIKNAIEEVLRFETPVQYTWRLALADIQMRDRVLEKGKVAYLCLASANRDPSHFGPDADTFDIQRRNATDAVPFGGGIHFCLGAPLARREAVSVVGALFRRFPKIELAGAPERHPRINFRSPYRLPVKLNA